MVRSWSIQVLLAAHLGVAWHLTVRPVTGRALENREGCSRERAVSCVGGMAECCFIQMLLGVSGGGVGSGAVRPGDLRVPELCHEMQPFPEPCQWASPSCCRYPGIFLAAGETAGQGFWAGTESCSGAPGPSIARLRHLLPRVRHGRSELLWKQLGCFGREGPLLPLMCA